MAFGVNKVILVGHVGQAPDFRTIPGGKSVCALSVATGESWKDKVTGASVERTEWHRVKLFDRKAETANLYVKKGSKIYIEGSLRTHKWQDKSGQDRYTTEILCDEYHLLDSKPKDNNQENIQTESPLELGNIPNDDIPF